MVETFFLASEEKLPVGVEFGLSLLERWMGGCGLFTCHILGRSLGPLLSALPLLFLLPLLVQFLLPFLEAVIALGHGGRSLKMTAEPFKGASVRRGFTGVLELSRP
jgi:hypothetical protein